jgi:hypothetical protein
VHRQAFPRTLLVANDDFAAHGRGMDGIHYAREHGLALRDDSIMVEPGDREYLSAQMAQEFWPIRPVILESQHYGHAIADGTWGDGSGYLRAIEAYHASYVSIHWWPREFLEANSALIDQVNLRLGYRLQITEASWPEQLHVGDRLEFSASWRNAGVAPCLPGGYPAITLQDANGGIAAVLVDETFDVRDLPPGESRPQFSWFCVPALVQPGEYQLYVSIGDGTGTPRIALPLAGADPHNRYRLGVITVQA